MWGTDIGYIKLTQSGGSVTGFFGTVESSESWRLEGTPSVDGLTLTGRVIVDQRTDHDQLFVVAMQPDWQAFAGVRWYASNPGFTVSFEGRRQ